MTPQQWQRVQEIVTAALEMPAGARREFVRDACGNDSALRVEVEALLAADAEAEGFLSGSSVVTQSRTLALEGVTIGHYCVESKLGAGGMGVVYRAWDTRLGRKVAIKVLPRQYSADPERLRRFEQEARLTAAINHPNILAIYDVGLSDGSPYLVSELLEGSTLRAVLGNGALPADTVIRYATQIAAGLEKAHQNGIIHRDLKPENLFVCRGGTVKILDFGVAKLQRPAMVPSGQQAATIATDTKEGLLLGTVGYMSPEQVRGADISGRSDLFSLGAILYEMLTGERAFQGASPADTISAILNAQPPKLTDKRATLPASLDYLVQHCLEKEPEDRFQSAADLRFVLEKLALSKSTEPPQPIGRLHAFAGLAILLAVATATAAAGYLLSYHSSSVSPVFTQLTYRHGTVHTARFLADGQSVVYDAGWNGNPDEVFSLQLAYTESRSLDLRGDHLLAVSPAGQAAVLLGVSHPWVLADPSGMLAEVPVTGGTPRELVANVNWADWSPSGELMIVRRVGGQSRLEFPIDHVLYQTTGWIAYPRISPSGDAIAFWDNPMRGDVGGPLILTTTTTGNTRMLTGGLAAQGLAWTPDGREVWFTARDPEVGQWVLWAVNRNGIRRQVWRVPGDLLIQDIANDGRVLLTIEKHRFSMAAAGPARPQQDFSLFEYSLIFDISSDGKQLLFADTTGGSATSSAVYMRQIDTNNAPLRLGSGGVAALSPDGQWVAALSEDYEHLGLIPTHAGNTRNLPRGTIERYATVTWLPDARHLVFVGNEPHHDRRYFLQDVAGGLAQPITPEGVSSYFYWPSISRDGRYVAALTNDGNPIAYPIAGGPARAIPGARVGDVPTRMWYPDGHSLLVYRPDEQPATVYRVDLASAIRVPVRQYMPNDSTGVEWIGPILFSQDFRAYGFSYCRDLSSLYLVSGLK